MNFLPVIVGVVFCVFYIIQGLLTGEIIVHGYNRSEGRYNRANRMTEPGKFWGYVVFYSILTVFSLGIALSGQL